MATHTPNAGNDDIVQKAHDFALLHHGDQRYGDQPYKVHLTAVATLVERWTNGDPILVAAAWTHDVEEDCLADHSIEQRRVTVADQLGPQIEATVWACTGTKATRAENLAEQLEKIKAFPPAAWVKAADRTSNMRACVIGLGHADTDTRRQRMAKLSRTYLDEFHTFYTGVAPYLNEAALAELREVRNDLDATLNGDLLPLSAEE